jgi:hypothetical protein
MQNKLDEIEKKIEEVVKRHLKEVGVNPYSSVTTKTGEPVMSIEYICDGNLIGDLATLIASERKDAVYGYIKCYQKQKMFRPIMEVVAEEYLKDSTSQSTNGGKIE